MLDNVWCVARFSFGVCPTIDATRVPGNIIFPATAFGSYIFPLSRVIFIFSLSFGFQMLE